MDFSENFKPQSGVDTGRLQRAARKALRCYVEDLALALVVWKDSGLQQEAITRAKADFFTKVEGVATLHDAESVFHAIESSLRADAKAAQPGRSSRPRKGRDAPD